MPYELIGNHYRWKRSKVVPSHVISELTNKLFTSTQFPFQSRQLFVFHFYFLQNESRIRYSQNMGKWQCMRKLLHFLITALPQKRFSNAIRSLINILYIESMKRVPSFKNGYDSHINGNKNRSTTVGPTIRASRQSWVVQWEPSKNCGPDSKNSQTTVVRL